MQQVGKEGCQRTAKVMGTGFFSRWISSDAYFCVWRLALLVTFSSIKIGFLPSLGLVAASADC